MLNDRSQNTRYQLEQAIAALEAQRAVLGDAVVDAALDPIYQKLAGLQDSAPPEQKRRLASILFMDIAGHTQIVRDLDPEENMEIIDHALARLAEPVRRHGGHIARYQGDGFKAVFGLPVAHENDPENAVHTGLDILVEAGRIAQEMETERGITGFSIRVGIDTGLVFSGGLTEGVDTIKGTPVNMAARLESASKPGTVLISKNTYQHVQEVFDFLPLEPVLAKGFDKPMPVFRVLGVKKMSFHDRLYGVEGTTSRMVGREVEIRQLQEAFKAVLENRDARYLTIFGEAGLGKTRLLYEFESWVGKQLDAKQILRGRARPETQRIPYGLLRDIFTSHFGIQDDDPVQVMRTKLETGFQEMLESGTDWRMNAHFVGHLLGFDFRDSPDLQHVMDDPKQVRDRALAYLIAFLKAVASAARPLLILLEDLHWADGSSLDLMNKLASALQKQPVLLVGTARPSLEDRQIAWMGDQALHHWLHLFPLPTDASNQLVEALLPQAKEIPVELYELVSTKADGNPFYTEELIKMLIQEGVIIKGQESWQVRVESLSHLHVPPTLAGILQARLDTLTTGERNILQQASVIGRIFWDAALFHLNQINHQGLTQEAVLHILIALQDKEMVYPRVLSAFAGAGEHIFKHTLLREVTYESVLLRLRRVYHAQIAEWLIALSNERLSEFSGMIADHLELAGKNDLAVEYLQKAGEQAAAAFANREAVEYYTRALSLIPEDQFAARFDLLHARNLVCDLSGDRDAQAADLPLLDDLAEHAAGTPEVKAIRKAKASQRRSKFAEQMGDFKEAALAAERTVNLAQAGGDVQLEAAGRIRWVVALWRQGYYDTAQELAEQTLVITQKSGVRLYEAHALIQLGNIAWFHNRLSQAASQYEQGLLIYQKINYPAGIAAVFHNLGLVSKAQEDDLRAEKYIRQAQDHFSQIGNKQGLAQAYVSLGSIAQMRWDIEQANHQYLSALQLVQEIRDRNYEAIIYSHLGRINLDSGDYPSARGYYDQGLELAISLGNRRTQCLALSEMGLTHAMESNFDTACPLIEQALSLADEIGLAGVKASVLLAYGYILTESKAYDQAWDVYSQLHLLCEQLDEQRLELEASAGLGRVALARNELESARVYAQTILESVKKKDSTASDLSLIIYLTCIQILTSLQDLQSGKVLEDSYRLLCKRQENFPDPAARERFIQAVPWHREIVRLWESR